ncbi:MULTISPECIES: hypothetical protein [unclassified Massilia]|uniref:hypothetical protein n=1 Tax=unclassified Massilia TaxID=2609279 RepID=UPI001B81047E|nr:MULTISPECIES: hypothetical protein [unclassified Massilia]MBQ5940266.1 hypothetical protein [Massilia sp. AB1]MBQ5962736.1 hypothetical protein [Massilia sp. ZL223]
MKKPSMHRLALLCLALGLGCAAHADEPGLCTSLCSTQKQECKANALEATENDTSNFFEMREKNPHARAAAQGQPVSDMTRTAERSDFEKRKQARFNACESKFRQCTRACTVPSSSVVLKKTGRAQ